MKRYALVIGIGEYDSPSLGKLSKTANDAKAVAEVLRQRGNFQDVTLLNNSVVNKQKVLGWVNYETLNAELTKFLEQAKTQDALIYFTGHGFTVEEDEFEKRGYLATSNSQVKLKGKQIIWQEAGFSFSKLNALIQKANLSSLLMLLDCCHSGFLIEDDLVKTSLLAFSRNNYCLIAACRSFQEAYALKSKDHSVFTGELLESLLEKNARRGIVTALDAFGFIDRELKGSGQEPIFLGMGGAIPIVSYAIVPEVTPDETSPYQGLEAFTEATAQFFFGRQKDVEVLWQKLEQSTLVSVIGASGSGKSSLVRAGLIPALKQSGTSWVVLEPIKPGLKPLQNLEAALKPVFQGLENQRLLDTCINEEESQGLLPLIAALSEGQRVLLVIDQFEEVFTISLPRQSRRFITLLTQVVEVPGSRLAVVITMRIDFVESCVQSKALKDLIQEQAVYLSPLTGSDLTDAIAKPAAKQGYRLTPDLLAEIVKDTHEEPGFLPLLQFALTKQWEYRDSQACELTSATYLTIGKLAGALDSHADQIYTYSDYIDPNTGEINLSAKQSRSQTEQDLIRTIMLRLVRTSEREKDTRQHQARSALISLADEIPEAQQQIELVLESLIKGRLLVSVGDMIDLAHEALIQGWKRLAGWCEESRGLRRLSQRLESARLEWEKDQHNPNLKPEEKDRNLMMGGLLAEVREQWEALIPYLQDFSKDEPFWQRSNAHEQDQIATLQRALTREETARAEAEAANRIKEEFLSVLSHELRTPLNPILGWTRVLRSRPFEPQSADRALETIERYAKLQSQLIEDLLDVARILGGKLRLNSCPVNLVTTIGAALEAVRLSAEAKDIQIQIVLNPEIGQVNGDADRLQQVVWNLLSNAIKFTPSGGRIEVRLTQIEADAQIQVSDNGQGIRPDFLPHVFENFRQGDSSTTRQFGGLGLGLALVRYLVELHGGTVSVESPGLGLGATFTVKLPLTPI